MSNPLFGCGGNINAWLQERVMNEEERIARLIDDLMDGDLTRAEAERIVFDE